jgi:hypothetical protein
MNAINENRLLLQQNEIYPDMKKITPLIIILLSFTISGYSQDNSPSRLSYSIAWTPIYYGPNDGEFRLDAIIPLSFESQIHYRILKQVEISTGIGFQHRQQSYTGWMFLSVYDPTKSEEWITNTTRIPIQVSYFLKNKKEITRSYLKTEYVNEFYKRETRMYSDNILADTFGPYKDYNASLFVGYGIKSKLFNSIYLISELAVGTYIVEDPFNGYQIKLKVGLGLK